MSRLPSEGTRLWVQAAPLGAGLAIVGATHAAPCVATLASTAGLAAGAIVQVDGTGWRSLDGRAYRVEAIDGANVALGHSDTTGETTAVAGGTVSVVDLMEFCTASLDVVAPASDDFDTTTIYDDSRSISTGMPAVNTWAAGAFWDASDKGEQRAWQLYRSREVVVFLARFSDGSGILFKANVNTLETHANVDQAITVATGGSISGAGGLLLAEPDFSWVVAGSPGTPSPDWIIAGSPAAPSPDTIAAGRVGMIA